MPRPGLGAGCLHFDGQGHGHLSLGQELYPPGLGGHQAGLFQDRLIYHAVRGKAVQIPQIDNGPGLPEDVGEAPLGDPPGQRHLATLKTRPFGPAGPGVLAFVAPARSLAPTGTRAAADPLLLMLGPRTGLQF